MFCLRSGAAFVTWNFRIFFSSYTIVFCFGVGHKGALWESGFII